MELFTEEEIAQRYNDFFAVADYFCQVYNEGGGSPVEVDPSLLFVSINAIYDDIARYKEYHLANPLVQKSNAIKRAAYACKWFMHFNPIIIPSSGHISGDFAEHDGLVNAMFAIHFAMSNLQIFTKIEADLSDEIYYSLLYNLVFRNISGEPLILIFELICKMLKGEEIFCVQRENGPN